MFKWTLKVCTGNLDLVSLTQDSSEAEDLRQPDSDPGGFPADSDLCQGGNGPTALLHPHYDQNCLHQLWVSKYTNNNFIVLQPFSEGEVLPMNNDQSFNWKQKKIKQG